MSSKKAKRCITASQNQNQRLTGRHIQALMDLQEMTIQNEKLKTKLDLIERELSSCFELHEIARSSQEKLANMEELQNKEFIKFRENIMAQNEKEISELVSKYETEKSQMSQTLCKLQQDNQVLLRENTRYKEDMEKEKEWAEYVKKLEDKCRCLATSLEDLEATNQVHERSFAEVQKENTNLLKQNTALKLDLETKITLLNELEHQVEEERSIKEKLADKNYGLREINELTKNVDELKKKNQELETSLDHTSLEKENLQQSLKDLKQQYSLLELEKDTIAQSSQDLMADVDFLRDQMDSLKIQHSNSPLVSSKSKLDLRKSSGVKHSKSPSGNSTQSMKVRHSISKPSR